MVSVLTHCLRRPKRAAAVGTGNHEKLLIVRLTVLVSKRLGLWPTTSSLVTLLKAVLVKMKEKLDCDSPGMRPK